MGTETETAEINRRQALSAMLIGAGASAFGSIATRRGAELAVIERFDGSRGWVGCRLRDLRPADVFRVDRREILQALDFPTVVKREAGDFWQIEAHTLKERA